jgi:lysophospholipase L1-like esterase
MHRFHRYVAIGDSSTEGLEDPYDSGGYRGWANRLAEHVAQEQGSLRYANLAVRGRRVRQILEQQLEPALIMRPDLATLFAGTNDVVRPSFDAQSVAADIEHMQRRLIAAGATVLGFTLPDLAGVMPLGRLVAPRVARLNEALRQVSAATGAILVDFTALPVASDRRLWNEDRLHANSLGHERIAAALAHALGLQGFDGTWARPLPPEPPATWARTLGRELRWAWRYLLPWIGRHLVGRSSGDGRQAKRPELVRMVNDS